MLLSISILCFNNVETTKDCIKHLIEYTPRIQEAQFILTDNNSSDKTLDYLLRVDLPNKIIIHNNSNLGFGMGHNKALEKATGEYFLVLNNDLMLKEHTWIEKAIAGLKKRKNTAFVGIDKTPCSLRSNGEGYFSTASRDYVEGSFMFGRTELFKKYGLFSKEIKMFCFEDSDISLRYRQMGFFIDHVRIDYKHLHAVTQRLIKPDVRAKIVGENQKVFMSRWRNYLQSRKFSNKIFITIPTVGIGDVIRMTNVFEGLRKDHPTAEIIVSTRFPEVFTNNPFIDSVTDDLNGNKDQYDRMILLNPNFGERRPLYETVQEVCATTGCKKPKLYITDSDFEGVRDAASRNPVLILTSSTHKNWQGRDWPHVNDFVRLFKSAYPMDYLISVGKGINAPMGTDLNLVGKTSLRQLFALCSKSKLVICTDSLLLHISQVFDIPCVCLFGATNPDYMFVPSSNTIPVVARGVPCIGCYQKKQKPVFNQCDRKDQLCMKSIQPQQVMTAIKEYYVSNQERSSR